MTTRYSSDVPTREPLRRRGQIKARRATSVYLVATPGVCLALYEGSDLLTLGSDVTIEFDPVLPGWWIVS